MSERAHAIADRLVYFFGLTETIPERTRRLFIGMLVLCVILLVADALLSPLLATDWLIVTTDLGMAVFLGVAALWLWRRRERQQLILFAIFAGSALYLLLIMNYSLQRVPPSTVNVSLLQTVAPWLIWFILLDMTCFLTFRAATALRMALIVTIFFLLNLLFFLLRVGPLSPVAIHDFALLFFSNALVILIAYPLAQTYEQSAQTDFLTSLSNRSHGYNALIGELERARRYNETFAIILFDIDYFKKINDSCGHPCGDAVLKQVGAFVNDRIRRTDLLCRWGGEEFLLLMTHCDLASARLKADHLRQQIKNRAFHADITLTASFGVTAYYPYDTANTLLERADNALYRAKRNGRNCVETE
jgi:diguanylate cyclase (GGDEF)-like protein